MLSNSPNHFFPLATAFHFPRLVNLIQKSDVIHTSGSLTLTG